MSYHCERCGAHLGDLATQCGCDLPPTKAEIDRARIGHATPILDTLRAELARVKAESLRVVVDGDMREAYRCDKVLHDGRYCVVGTRILDDYFPVQISDAITGKYVDKVTHQTLLQPVRLERWEDE